ncbi:hypothetical protein O0L34_g9439 [Tuta absoluta]|nr:hypothetical protein O0L34_g9439 [Tuta absoluta]
MSFPVLNTIIRKPGAVVRENTNVCRGCLATDIKLFSLHEKRRDQAFTELTGILVSNGVVCCVCLHLLRKFQAFRLRCHDADSVLHEVQNDNGTVINLIDRKLFSDLEPSLTTTVPFHTDFPPEYNIPLLADDNGVFIKTKEEQHDSNSLIGEFITKDDIDIGHIKQDDFEDPGFIEHNDNNVDLVENNETITKNTEENDFPWQDQNDYSDSDDNTVLTKLASLKNNISKPKSETLKKRKVKREKKDKPKKSYRKTKRVKVERDTSEDEEIVKPEKKPKKVQEEDYVLSTKIAATLRSIWKKNKNKDMYQLFERIYNESLNFKHKKEESIFKSAESKSIKDSQSEDIHKIRLFLELVQKLSSLYRVDTEFVRLEDLRKEMEEKRNSGKYKVEDHGCEHCCKQYNFLETYKRHMNRNHNPDWEIECDICRYRFKTQRDFLAHIMMHARIIKCQDCNALIPSKWCDAKKHAECHRGVVHTCTICNQTFTRKKSLSMHLRAKHRSELEVVMCLLCGDTYNGEEGLRIHIRCIHKQATQCHSCGVWFESADILAVHTRPESGGCQPHHSACPMCGANFDNLDTMLEHHKQLHPMYKCAECKITFESGKICVHFKYNHNLVKGKMKVPKRRSRLYNKDIICEVCGKNNFTCVATLKIHQRIHTGERPYTCEICQKTFRMRSDLKLHSAIHTGERSYKCPYCPRAFRQPPHLKSHLPTHTKEKAYECEICHKRFTQRANMQEHVRTIHEGLPPKRRQRHSKIFEA